MSKLEASLAALAVAFSLAAPCPVLAADQTRVYYIAAEERAWDYAPAGEDLMMGMSFHDEAKVYVERGEKQIGSTHTKAIYVEYTDATFTIRKPRASDEAYLGLLGPIMRAEVGDKMRVVFKNMASRRFSIHPHGVFYTKANEGAAGNDGTPESERADDAVPPGETYAYEWSVPERAGPGPSDPSSIAWPYHSHVDSIKDSNAGLVGAIIISRKGQARPDGRPAGVDKEFVTLFNIFDENLSWYIDDDIAALPGQGAGIDRDSDDFRETNLKHAVNGYLFGNMPMPTMTVGETVRWYLIGLGTETDVHTPHWHGNTVLVSGHRLDTATLLPATTVVADMAPDAAGIWMFHCHVNDHIKAGMTGRYEVKAR